MAEASDPKLVEWTERLSEGETGAATARDTLFEAVCSALGATPAELAAAAGWAPRRPDAPPFPPPVDAPTSTRPRSRGGTASATRTSRTRLSR